MAAVPGGRVGQSATEGGSGIKPVIFNGLSRDARIANWPALACVGFYWLELAGIGLTWRRIGGKSAAVGSNWPIPCRAGFPRSEEHTSEIQSLMRHSYYV